MLQSSLGVILHVHPYTGSMLSIFQLHLFICCMKYVHSSFDCDILRPEVLFFSIVHHRHFEVAIWLGFLFSKVAVLSIKTACVQSFHILFIIIIIFPSLLWGGGRCTVPCFLCSEKKELIWEMWVCFVHFLHPCNRSNPTWKWKWFFCSEMKCSWKLLLVTAQIKINWVHWLQMTDRGRSSLLTVCFTHSVFLPLI